MSDFIGACPLCSLQMFRVSGGIVKCPSDHYSIFEKKFDELWAKYSLDKQAIGLLEELRSENLINRTMQKD